MPDILPAAPIPPQTPGNYLWEIAAKKVAYAIAKGGVAFLSSVAVQAILIKYGVHVDPILMTGSLSTVIYGGLEWLHDYAKVKFKLSWL